MGEIATPGGFAGSGELIRIANTSELRVEVRILEPDSILKPDMSVRLRFLDAAEPEPAAALEPSVLVRADALRRDAQGSYV